MSLLDATRSISARVALIGAVAVGVVLVWACSRRREPDSSIPGSVSGKPARQGGVAEYLATAALKPKVTAIASIDPHALSIIRNRLVPDRRADLSLWLHTAHVFGRSTAVPDAATGRSVQLLEIILDSDRSAKYFGGGCSLFRTRFGAAFPENDVLLLGTDQTNAESHPGQALSILATLGLPLDTMIRLPQGREANLGLVADDLIANFALEGEIYWKAVALAIYVPPKAQWTNKFGDVYSFDALAVDLLGRDPAGSSCCGTHRLIALVTLARVDEQSPVLSAPVRERVWSHLGEVSRMLERTQSPEGCWYQTWHRGLSPTQDAPAMATGKAEDGVLATGHHLEWLMLLPDGLRPANRCFQRAAAWLLQTLSASTQDSEWVHKWYCPVSHAARVLTILAVQPPAEHNASGSTAVPLETEVRGDFPRPQSIDSHPDREEVLPPVQALFDDVTTTCP